MLQGFAHAAGHRPRRHACLRRGAVRKQMCDARRPHLRVFRRCKTVQIDRIRRAAQFGQCVLHVAEKQIQRHRALIQMQPVQPRREHRPGGAQFCRQRLPLLRPVCVDAGKVLPAQRITLNADEMQRRAALRIVAPGRPGSGEIQPGAKAGFQNHKPPLPAPAFRQTVAAQKHMRRLPGAARAGVIDVVKLGGSGRAVFQKGNFGGRDRRVGRHDGCVKK